MHVKTRAAVLTLALACASSSAFADEKAACIAAAEVGQGALNARKLSKARESFLTCVADACPKVVRDSCDGWLREVAQLQPTVVFGARDAAGGDLVQVRVLVDGTEVLSTITGKAIPLDPGPHKVTFVHATLGKVDLSIVVAESVKGREVLGAFSGPKAAGPTAAGPIATGTSEPTDQPAGARAQGSTLPFIVGGVGAVALIASGVFYLQYSNKKSSLATACGEDGLCPRSEADTIDAAKRAEKYSIITGVLGVAGVGVGTWLFMSERNKTTAWLGVSPSGAMTVGAAAKFLERSFNDDLRALCVSGFTQSAVVGRGRSPRSHRGVWCPLRSRARVDRR